MDVDSHIPPGVDFVEVIEKNVASCDVLIAVIGRFWLTARDEKKQRRRFEKEERRLDNPRDYMRLEIATALKRGIRVIPAVVDGASMPQWEELPQDLKPLVRRQALTISHDRFHADADSLVGAVERALEKTTAEQQEREEEGRLKAERVETEGKERVEREGESPLERATKRNPWVNSLGMKFVPVAGTQVLFSVWDTRVQDFEAFVADTNYDATTWRREPDFSQGPTHPVVEVSWNDAKKFCEWLTRREQGSGMLPLGRLYRLPTDAEWSVGVGLRGEEGNTPQEKSSKIELFPWGEEWPPPKGTGNYAGEECKSKYEYSFAEWLYYRFQPKMKCWIKGYNDGYPCTSPVGSFAVNANGLCDMGGNVWQWCEDWYDATKQRRVFRGASFDEYNPVRLLASYRGCFSPVNRFATYGFRCVVGAESSR